MAKKNHSNRRNKADDLWMWAGGLLAAIVVAALLFYSYGTPHVQTAMTSLDIYEIPPPPLPLAM